MTTRMKGRCRWTDVAELVVPSGLPSPPPLEAPAVEDASEDEDVEGVLEADAGADDEAETDDDIVVLVVLVVSDGVRMDELALGVTAVGD